MSKVGSEFQEYLELVINHKPPDEVQYEQHIQSSELKLHGHIIHECESEVDNVQIVAQLSRSSDDCITLNDSATGGSTSSSRQTGTSCDYIKAVRVSHGCNKSKSLDSTHNTRITTIIGNRDMPFETVIDASIDPDGTMSSNHSFTRRSLPDTINMVTTSDQAVESVARRIKKTLKNAFKKGKQNKKKQQRSIDITSEELDRYALERVTKDKRKLENSTSDFNVEPEKFSKLSESDRISSPYQNKIEKTASSSSFHSLSFSKAEVPFKSYHIGQELPRIKLSKAAKLQRILAPMISPSIRTKPNFSTNTEDMIRNKPKAVAVEIKNNVEFHYTLDSNSEQFKQTVGEMRCQGGIISSLTPGTNQNTHNDQCSNSKVMSEFDVPVWGKAANNEEQMVIQNDTNDTCQCKAKKKRILADVLYHMAESKDTQELTKEVRLYDTSVSHFQYCHLYHLLKNNNNNNENDKKSETISDRMRRKSEPTPPTLRDTKCERIHPGNESYPSLPSDIFHDKQSMVVTTRNHKSSSTSGELHKSTVSLYSSSQCYMCDEEEEEEEEVNQEVDDGDGNSVVNFNCGECDDDQHVLMASSKSADDDLTSEFIGVIPRIIDDLQQDKQIRVKPVHTKYFCRPHCYDHFEKGVSEAIGTDCTLENVALLHFLVRCIIKETNTPLESKLARSIKCNAEQFFMDHYKPTIVQKHGSIEAFIYDNLTSQQPISPDVD